MQRYGLLPGMLGKARACTHSRTGSLPTMMAPQRPKKTEPTKPQRSCEVVVVFWADELLRKDVTHGEAREGCHGLHQERLGGQSLVVRCPYSSHVPALWVEKGLRTTTFA